MFRKLFGIGDEAKLAFKSSSTDGIARLATEYIPATERRYWATFIRIFDTPGDVFDLLSVSDIRRTLAAHPENIATLVRILVEHLESLRDDPLFSPAPSIAGAANGTSRLTAWMPAVPGLTGQAKVGDGGAQDSRMGARDRKKEALNALRCLTRVLPVVMEGGDVSKVSDDGSAQEESSTSQTSASVSFKDSLLWTPGSSAPLGADAPASPEEAQFVIDDADEGGSPMASAAVTDPLTATNPSPAAQAQSREPAEPTLAERLLLVTIDLLFYAGFTAPWTDDQLSTPSLDSDLSNVSRVHHAIWEKGVGSSEDLAGTDREHEANRVEVLRLLVVLLSKSVYIPASQQRQTDDAALRFVTQKIDRAISLPLLCSLLNTCSRITSPPGWLGLPYTRFVREPLFGNPGDIRNMLVALSLQTLTILLTYEPKSPNQGQTEPASTLQRPPYVSTASSASVSSSSGGSAATHNNFSRYVSKLHRHADFVFLSEGLLSLISAPMVASGQLLAITAPANNMAIASASGAVSAHVPEALMALWTLLSRNRKFRSFLLDSPTLTPRLTGVLLYYALAERDILAQQGLVRLCVFILQDISAEKSFGLRISAAGSGARCALPARFAPRSGGGTAADVLIQSVYTLIATTRGALSSLYVPLVLSLTNTAPYWRGLSIASSTRLVQLFHSFSAPTFILADEGNPRILYYLLEALTYVLHYQHASNPTLVYALVNAHERVDKLQRFTLRSGLADIRRMRSGASRASRSDSYFQQPGSAPAAGPQTPSLLSPSADVAGRPLSAEEEKASLARRDEEGAPVPATDTNASATEVDLEAGLEQSPISPSDKSRGKRRESSGGLSEEPATPSAPRQDDGLEDDLVAQLNEDELYEAAQTVGRNGFVPTQRWVQSWQEGLPLGTLQSALDALVPRVQELCASSDVANKADADERVLAFLREQTLVGALPAAPTIHARTFQWTDQATVWLLSYLWGVIYVSHLLPFGIWSGTETRLFNLVQDRGRAASRGGTRGAGDASAGSAPAMPLPGVAIVSNAMGSVWEVIGGRSSGETTQAQGR